MAQTVIMVVNDDAAFFENLRQAFAQAGETFDVFNAISGARAIGLATARQPAAVIIDGDMIGVDGYELTRELKQTDEMKRVPVVILADQPNESSALRARQSGAAAHLRTQTDPRTIVDKVVALLGAAETSPVPAGVAVSVPAGYGVPEPVIAGVAPQTAPPMPANQGAPEPARLPGYTGPSAAPAPSATPGPGLPPMPPMPVTAKADAPNAGEVPHIDDLLWIMINRGGSDLHITVGSAPGIRLRGEILPIEDQPVLTARDTQTMILNLLSEEQRKRFETELELDFAYSIPGVSRFRANVFQQRNSMGAVFRVIPLAIPTMDQLALPKVCKFLSERPRGLVLVTGPTGSGKSTTLAAMVDHINESRPCHIITLEDPIEFMHRNKRAYVNQREVGEDTHSFADALKRVLRQDPDVILVGEMRDLETISAAITAAETGHLVLATLHTTGGPATVDRIIDVFPPHQQQQVRMQLSGALEGVLSQVLLRSTDGKSRVMALEIMLGVPAISNLIREGKTHQMATIIQGGAAHGMQTLDQHLKQLLQAGKVTYEEAMGKAQNPKELAQMMGK